MLKILTAELLNSCINFDTSGGMRLGTYLLHVGPGRKESMSLFLVLNTHFRYLDAEVNKVVRHMPESWPSQLTW